MVNNFESLKNSIRSIAKRCKSVSYSTALVVSFAMLGANAFSQENILTGKEINNKAVSLEENLKNIKDKNSKKLEGARLELIQLMEQGDQVVKSPWSSWQFGLNYMHDNYKGEYKGRGDKSKKYPYEGIFARSNDKIIRSVAENSSQYSKLKYNSIFGSALSSNRKGFSKNYGIDLTKNTLEPMIDLEVNVGIRPRTFSGSKIQVELPTITVTKGSVPTMTVDIRETIEKPVIKGITLNINLPQPNTKPYNKFSFYAPQKFKRYIQYGNADYVEETYDKILGGVKVPVDPADPDGPKKIEYNEEVNITDIDGEPYKPGKDWIGVHTVWNGRVKDTHIILRNKADAFSLETWHAPKMAFKDSSVTIKGDDNTVFYFFPAEPWRTYQQSPDYHAFSQRGAFIGELDIDISSQRNAIFSMMGAAGSFNIAPEGVFKLEGANNIIFSGLGYSGDLQQVINYQKANSSTVTLDDIRGIYDRYDTGMTPIINLKKYPEIYGDGNVAYYFSDLLPDGPSEDSLTRVFLTEDNHPWRPTKIGIYQGEINAKAIVGNKLTIGDDNEQTDKGDTLGNKKYTQGVAVLFAQSGQRKGLVPTRDLNLKDVPHMDYDEIHPLYVNDVNMIFGKYSLKTVGIVADRGTQIDVAMPTNTHTELKAGVALRSDSIIDYKLKPDTDKLVISDKDDTNEAATGTIFAYAKGKWGDSTTRTTPGDGYTPMEKAIEEVPGLTEAKSEINFGVGVITSARYKNIDGVNYYPVTYVAEGGIITAKDTEAKGYGSIVAYAKEGGEITIKGPVIAKDDWAAEDAETKPYLNKNIAAYATGNGSKIIIADGNNPGNTIAKGMGALAENNGEVELNGSANSITVGEKTVGLFANTGGTITFGGGKILVKDEATPDSMPFYASEGNNSKINFTGPTTIDMTNGFIQIENGSDYSATSGDTKRYSGMENVTLNLAGTAKLKHISNEDIIWAGLEEMLRHSIKIAGATVENAGNNLDLYYSNGNLLVNTDVNLDSALDGFNGIKMEREKVTINTGNKVSSTTGKGLKVASSAGASQTDNGETGYINNGTVEISGGTIENNTVALAVNYGSVDNEGMIKVDTGTGIFGTNGSKLENNASGSIEISGKGYGIVGSSSETGVPSASFGKDNGATVKAIDIANSGNIKIGGNDSVAIYADNNTDAPQSEVIVSNSGIIEIGDKSIGIAIKGDKGGKISVGGSGNTYIKAGKGSIGIQGENSEVSVIGDYTTEIEENGVGIYLTGNSTTTAPSKTLNYKYTGAADAQGTAIAFDVVNGKNNISINLDNTTNGKLIGIYANGTGTFTNTGKIAGTLSGIGIAAENTSVVNSGDITLGDAATITNPNIGIFAKDDKVTNSGDIEVGDNSIGIYGKRDIVSSGTITAGDKGIGIYSIDGNVTLSKALKVGANEASGIYALGNNKTIQLNGVPTMDIGNNSFGIVNKGSGNTISADVANVKLDSNSAFIYSTDSTGTIESKSNLTNVGSTGGNYGIYSVGKVSNSGTIDLRYGIGNIGIYVIDGGEATNTGTIVVGESDVDDENYSIGMAAGIKDERGIPGTKGSITNNGTIVVKGKDSIGMYVVHKGSVAINTKDIILDADNTIGIYADEYSTVENTGKITTGSGNYNNVTGIYLRKRSTLVNKGTINIVSNGGQALYLQGGIVKNYGTITLGGTAVEVNRGTGATTKTVGAITIEALPGDTDATIKVETPTGIVIKKPTVVVANGKVDPGTVSANSIGLYIDTSGIRFTNPIQNLGTLTQEADLIVGTEATMGTNDVNIVVDDSKILEPYNESILNNLQVEKWKIYSGGLTWMATATLDETDGTIEKLYMSKIEYTEFAGDKNTYNFLDGLEQRYGMNSLGSKEKQVFNKLNGIGKNEEILFNQAVDEMMGHQYANVQQRIHDTGRILDKEFKYLKDEWRTMSKDSNKVKVFGMNGEYSTDTAGVIDYKSDAYGVAYLGENETLKLGDTSGWYAGLVENRFKFKDYGKSKEKQLQGKFGVFKSVPFDYNNSLNWTISGEGFVGYNKMDRKYLVVDEIFGAKSNYWSYGVALRNELSKNFRMTESTNFKVYGAVKAEYGRYSDIKEKSGEVKLEVKANDYLSIKPEIGGELGYKHLLNDNYFFNTKLNVAYENELGELNDVDNKARVKDTTADWYNLRSEKEDRKGNVRTDLSIGVDNERYGVTANIGYDTKGKNRRVGLGLRVIF